MMLDINAAGLGWFVDPTPSDDAEYKGGGTIRQAIPSSDAADKIDLLSVMVHEFGHMLNLTHAQFGFMDETLAAGTRTVSNSPAPTGESSQARVLDDSGTLMLDRKEARLLRLLDFRIGD